MEGPVRVGHCDEGGCTDLGAGQILVPCPLAVAVLHRDTLLGLPSSQNLLNRVAQRQCSFRTRRLRLGLPTCAPRDPVLDEIGIPPRQSVLEPFSIIAFTFTSFDGLVYQYVKAYEIKTEP